MSGHAQAVTIRQATHEDYQQVIDINDNIYDGMDHLPDMFHYYIQHPNAHCYVAENEGRIVGFSIGYLIDGGKRIASVANRTAADVQGQGVMYQLTKGPDTHISKLLKTHPQLCTQAFTTNRAEHYEAVSKSKPSLSVICKWHFIAFTVESDKYRTESLDLPWCSNFKINMPTHEELHELITDQNLIGELFKGESYLVCLYSWLPLLLTEQNLIYMAKHSVVMTTRDEHSGKVCALSHSCLSKVPLGVQLRFHIKHTGTGVDAKTIAAHIMAHVIYASKRSLLGGNVGLVIAFPLDISLNEVCGLLEPVFGKRIDTGSDFGVLVHEKLPFEQREM